MLGVNLWWTSILAIQGGVERLLVASCYRTRAKLWPGGPLSLYADFTYQKSAVIQLRLDIVVFSDQIVVVILARHWQELTATFQQFSLLTNQKLERWLWMTTVLILFSLVTPMADSCFPYICGILCENHILQGCTSTSPEAMSMCPVESIFGACQWDCGPRLK